eukprot:467778-Pelagomonas_calceolata.AAC.4
MSQIQSGFSPIPLTGLIDQSLAPLPSHPAYSQICHQNKNTSQSQVLEPSDSGYPPDAHKHFLEIFLCLHSSPVPQLSCTPLHQQAASLHASAMCMDNEAIINLQAPRICKIVRKRFAALAPISNVGLLEY